MDGQYLPDDELDIDSLASSEPPEYVPQMFSKGGEVEEEDIDHYAKGGEASFDQSVDSMNQFLLADEADTAYAPMYPSEPKASERSTKTAKLMLKQLSTKSGGGKSKRSKEMSLETGDLSPAIPELGAPQTEQEKLTQIATARSQYDALEQAYKLKAQAAQRAGKGLLKPTFSTVMFDQPTLEKPGPLMARTFAKGGEADALEGMQKKARENEMYRASEKYLNSRGQMPDIELKRMGFEDGAVFSSFNLPIGSGTITINKDDIDRNPSHDVGPALLAHEITHAADRQMKQQAIEQRGKGTKFAEAYEKLYGAEGRNRLEPAKRADYEWTEGNRSYRSTPGEIAAFGVGAFSAPLPKYMTPGRTPLHVDPTAATEFQILLDLAQRDIDKGPKGLERVPTFLRKFFKYADGGPVKPIKMAAGGLPFAPTAMVRPSTREELDKIKAEYVAYEPKVAEYNTALEKYKTDVYNPYKTQAEAYNAALEKYKAEQFNPYETQVNAYNAALEKYNTALEKYKTELDKHNAGFGEFMKGEPHANVGYARRIYASMAPKAPAEFSMAVPTAPAQFSGVAPTAPAEFAQKAPTAPTVSPEDYKAKMAAAKKNTANRQLALNVAMDPEAYGLSMPKLFAKGGPVYRADGSPDTGERMTPQQIERLAADQAALNQYYAPRARPSTGMNRQKGPISKQLDTGEAYINMAKGVTELPYDLLGAPRDISNLIMTPFGYGVKNPVMGSDWIKEQMTRANVRPEPPADPTSKGFYTAGELLSNLTNPAGVTRSGVKVAKKTGEVATDVAKDFQQYNRQFSVPGASYISRPPGGYFPTSRGMAEKTAEEINNTKLSDLPEEFVTWLSKDDKQKGSFLGLGPKRESLGEKYNRWKTETGNKDYTFGILSGVDKSLQPVLKKITKMEPGKKRDALFQMFNQKAKDFYSKQAGSVQDPLRADILGGNIKFDMDSKMGDVFPQVLVEQAAQGNIQALRLLEKSYDDMLGIKAVVPYRRVLSRPDDIPPPNVLKAQIIESVRDNLDSIPDSQLLAYAGKKPLPGPDGVAKAAKEVRLKLKENPNLFSTVLEPNIERTVFARESRYSDLDLAKHPNLYGTTATEAMINPQGPAFTKEQFDAMDALPPGYFLPELETAINKSQPMLDAQEYGNLKLLGLNPDNLLQEASKLSTKDLNSMGFTDFLKKAYTSTQEMAQLEKDLEKVKPLLRQGKPPPAKAMLFGVTDFLPTVNGMRWVKVTDPDGVKSIAAGMNNSVGSYATSNVYGALGRGRRALDNGEVEIYSLYDKNHIPQVTVEYATNKASVPENFRGRIVELTGNGPLTANELPEKFSAELVDFVNKLGLSPKQIPIKINRIIEKNFFNFDEGKFVRNEEEFAKHQALQKELGLAKGGSVDKNTAFIKAHT